MLLSTEDSFCLVWRCYFLPTIAFGWKSDFKNILFETFLTVFCCPQPAAIPVYVPLKRIREFACALVISFSLVRWIGLREEQRLLVFATDWLSQVKEERKKKKEERKKEKKKVIFIWNSLFIKTNFSRYHTSQTHTATVCQLLWINS